MHRKRSANCTLRVSLRIHLGMKIHSLRLFFFQPSTAARFTSVYVFFSPHVVTINRRSNFIEGINQRNTSLRCRRKLDRVTFSTLQFSIENTVVLLERRNKKIKTSYFLRKTFRKISAIEEILRGKNIYHAIYKETLVPFVRSFVRFDLLM